MHTFRFAFWVYGRAFTCSIEGEKRDNYPTIWFRDRSLAISYNK